MAGTTQHSVELISNAPKLALDTAASQCSMYGWALDTAAGHVAVTTQHTDGAIVLACASAEHTCMVPCQCLSEKQGLSNAAIICGI
jgi:hypothetical protein